MTQRVRKLMGGLGMIVFVLAYAMIAMALADSRPMQRAPALVQTVLYMVLGLAWAPPLMPVIRWMERGPKA